mmetsp:Transcript_40677/g.73288  ORF Transcript_40677/g.73288 Transcript_40677/m.73288 type:complete len:665 (-) Transcript_40677:248-2242(-)
MATAAATTSELQVRLCGSSAKIPLQANEGLEALRARVAGAFGLTSSFDLVGPEGQPLRTDEDAIQAALKENEPGSAMRPLAVRAGEDALLDLERAHEESGGLRWALLRQLLGDLRTKNAELAAAIGEGQHRTTLLEQQLLHEKNAREATGSALKAELAELKDIIAADIQKTRQESQASLEAAVADFTSKIKFSSASQTQALQAAIDVSQEGLRTESACRQREADEALRRLEELRKELCSESNARAEALTKAAAAMTSELDAKMTAESKERFALKASLEAADTSQGKALEEMAARHTSAVTSIEMSLAEVDKRLQVESTARAAGLLSADASSKSLTSDFTGKLESLKASIDDRFSSIDGMEIRLRSLIDAEKVSREEGDKTYEEPLREVSCKLEANMLERKTSEEKAAAVLATLQEVAFREQRAREAAGSEVGRLIGALTIRLDAQEKKTAEASTAARAEADKLQRAMVDFMTQERTARESTCKEIAIADSKKHSDWAEEARKARTDQAEESRQWAQTLVESLSTRLQDEQQARFQELKRCCEELADSRSQQTRRDLTEEVRRVDLATTQAMTKQQASLEEERKRYDQQAKTAAQEVKAALDAHGEFAEALEKEQRLLIARLQEIVDKESQARDSVTKRVSLAEFDLQKVKGHLPILFAPPSSFR